METKKTKTPKKAKKNQNPEDPEEVPKIPKEVEQRYERFFVIRKLGVFYMGIGYKKGQHYVIDLFHDFYEVPVSDSVAEELLSRDEDIVYSRGPYDDYFYDPREFFDE